MTDKNKEILESKLADFTKNYIKDKSKDELSKILGTGVPEVMYNFLKQLNVLKIDPEKTRDLGYFHLDSMILSKLDSDKEYIYKLWGVIRRTIDTQIMNLSMNKYVLKFFINGKGYAKTIIYARTLDEATYQLKHKNIPDLLPATIEEVK